MSKFKVGDKVRILKACSGTKVGSIVSIISINGYLYADGGNGNGCNCNGYYELVSNEVDSLESSKEVEKEPSSRLGIG